MSNKLKYLVPLPVVLFAAGLVACNPSNTDTTAGMDTSSDTVISDSGSTATDTMGSAATDSSRMSPSTAGSNAQISITNPMPHEMTVSADWGQGQKELGSVKPNETKTFDVAAGEGTKIDLVASDKDRTHSPKGSVTLESGQAATWTIQ